MNLIQAIIMGIVQGATEFLPVSSSGHLSILKNIFNMETNAGLLFETLLHLGTLVAVCIVYKKDIAKLIVAAVEMLKSLIGNARIKSSNKKTGEDEPLEKVINTAYKKFVVLIIVTSIPTAVVGLILSKIVEGASGSLLVTGICLVITAIILLASDMAPMGRKKVKGATNADAAIVGVVQGIAALPGISRSGSTIAACVFLGFDRQFAVRYSFIASLPAIIGANLLELRHIGEMAEGGTSLVCCLAGMLVAGIVGYGAIKLTQKAVAKNMFQYFAYYCAGIGIISILFYFFRH